MKTAIAEVMAIPVKNRRSRRQRSSDTDEEFSVVDVVVTMGGTKCNSWFCVSQM